jgi:quercetin dioxygenase-like cupin family protein/DNA-binding Xre family transcriptional regulator
VATTPSRTHSLGEALRTLRAARGYSLGDVAAATGISRSFLSLVENGKSDITVGRLTRLLEFFDVSLSDLVPAPAPADPEIVRPAERRLLRSESEGIDFILLAPDRERQMMPMLVEFQPGAQLAEHGQHPGEEFILVLSGELELDLERSAPRRLKAGDAAYYPGTRPHRYRNASQTKPLRLLCVDTPPVF